MSAAHRTSFTVRSYEIDSYSHLNNGVYVSWFEQARLEHLQSLGFSYDGFAERRQWFVVARTEVDFRRPLNVGDRVEVTSAIEALGRSSVRYRQVMRLIGPGGAALPESPLASEALTTMVFTGEGGRSIPIPADFREALEHAGGARHGSPVREEQAG